MGKKLCSVCLSAVEREDAPILAMGAYGTPRYLCDKCIADIECMTLGRNYDEIAAAMERVSTSVAEKNIDDPVTVSTVKDMLEYSAKRAKDIKDGTYDFSLDEVEPDKDGESLEEIPEELLESEEDKLLDKQDEERENKLDKILNWVWLAIIVGVVGFFAWWIIF